MQPIRKTKKSSNNRKKTKDNSALQTVILEQSVNSSPNQVPHQCPIDDYFPLLDAIVSRKSVGDVLNLMESEPRAVRHKGTNGDYPLHAACQCAKYDTVILKLVDMFPQACQEPNVMGNYPLHIACYHDQSVDVVLKLIDTYPEAAAIKSSYDDRYALHLACKLNASVQVVGKLVELYPMALQVIDSLTASLGWYPIHDAAYSNQLEYLKLFVNACPLVLNQTTKYNQTLLHLACSNNYVDMVEYLLQFTEIQINKQTNHGRTPLYDACQWGWEEIVVILLRHPDISLNATTDTGASALHIVIDYLLYDGDVPQGSFESRVNIVRSLLLHPFIIVHQKNEHNIIPSDIVMNEINKLEELDDDDPVRAALPYFLEMERLFVDFEIKRKWQAYEYFLFQKYDRAISCEK